MKDKLTRYDIDAEINENREAYHYRQSNPRGEYVLYADVEKQIDAMKCCGNCKKYECGWCPDREIDIDGTAYCDNWQPANDMEGKPKGGIE